MGQHLPPDGHGSFLLPPLHDPLRRRFQCCVQHLCPFLGPVDGGSQVLPPCPPGGRGSQVRCAELHGRCVRLNAKAS